MRVVKKQVQILLILLKAKTLWLGKEILNQILMAMQDVSHVRNKLITMWNRCFLGFSWENMHISKGCWNKI